MKGKSPSSKRFPPQSALSSALSTISSLLCCCGSRSNHYSSSPTGTSPPSSSSHSSFLCRFCKCRCCPTSRKGKLLTAAFVLCLVLYLLCVYELPPSWTSRWDGEHGAAYQFEKDLPGDELVVGETVRLSQEQASLVAAYQARFRVLNDDDAGAASTTTAGEGGVSVHPSSIASAANNNNGGPHTGERRATKPNQPLSRFQRSLLLQSSDPQQRNRTDTSTLRDGRGMSRTAAANCSLSQFLLVNTYPFGRHHNQLQEVLRGIAWAERLGRTAIFGWFHTSHRKAEFSAKKEKKEEDRLTMKHLQSSSQSLEKGLSAADAQDRIRDMNDNTKKENGNKRRGVTTWELIQKAIMTKPTAKPVGKDWTYVQELYDMQWIAEGHCVATPEEALTALSNALDSQPPPTAARQREREVKVQCLQSTVEDSPLSLSGGPFRTLSESTLSKRSAAATTVSWPSSCHVAAPEDMVISLRNDPTVCGIQHRLTTGIFEMETAQNSNKKTKSAPSPPSLLLIGAMAAFFLPMTMVEHVGLFGMLRPAPWIEQHVRAIGSLHAASLAIAPLERRTGAQAGRGNFWSVHLRHREGVCAEEVASFQRIQQSWRQDRNRKASSATMLTAHQALYNMTADDWRLAQMRCGIQPRHLQRLQRRLLLLGPPGGMSFQSGQVGTAAQSTRATDAAAQQARSTQRTLLAKLPNNERLRSGGSVSSSGPLLTHASIGQQHMYVASDRQRPALDKEFENQFQALILRHSEYDGRKGRGARMGSTTAMPASWWSLEAQVHAKVDGAGRSVSSAAVLRHLRDLSIDFWFLVGSQFFTGNQASSVTQNVCFVRLGSSFATLPASRLREGGTKAQEERTGEDNNPHQQQYHACHGYSANFFRFLAGSVDEADCVP